jgi:hypothetical protein
VVNISIYAIRAADMTFKYGEEMDYLEALLNIHV